MALPADIQEIFFDTMIGEKSVADFEQWVYADQRLEKILPDEAYLELISYGYNAEPVIRNGLFRLLERLIDRAAFEKFRLLKMMHRALKRDEKLPGILISTYDLYCKGYSFMDNLGLVYGLAVDFPYSSYGANSWDELNEEQRRSLIGGFGPELEQEIKKVIYWIESGLVLPTGERDEMDHYKFIDKRSEQEKEPTAYKIIK